MKKLTFTFDHIYLNNSNVEMKEWKIMIKWKTKSTIMSKEFQNQWLMNEEIEFAYKIMNI